MQHINLGHGIITDTDAELKPMSHYEIVAFRLRSARLAWLNAKTMIKMANKGAVDKGQAFKVMNYVRRDYKAAIKFTETCLGASKTARIMLQATIDYQKGVRDKASGTD